MSVFKCKMCGGALEITPGQSTVECEYCGSMQTLPKMDDDRKANLYDRANHFRRNNEFDKAMGIYEQILNEDTMDAEAYWSLVLCRYGIEYVEDPATRRRVPTVNRAQYTSVFDDDNYKSALKYADTYQKTIYEKEANDINEIQKGILAISQKEEPFDVFICYKETDNNGRRTPDSVLANDLYHQLTNEGFKVFFSRITLEDKLGTAYEPYIFAALNSAKVMVALGTKPEYFNAVWVKNEWSRYLALIRNGAKKMLIPAYRDMDPYDLPEEFSHLQAQDMSRLGFMQDLIRGIKKIIIAEAPKTAVKETVVVNAGGSGASTAPLLDRVFLFLEDGKWDDANIYCEKVLDIDPRNSEAYLGKLMAELNVTSRKKLSDCAEPFDNKDNYKKVLRFGDSEIEAEMRGYIAHINERNKNERKTGIYNKAMNAMKTAKTKNNYQDAINQFSTIEGFKDADNQVLACKKMIDVIKAKEEAKKKTTSIAALIAAACAVFIIILTMVIMPAVSINNLKSGNFNVGDTVTMGNYHDSKEWIVLDKQGDKALLISKYALDCQEYNSSLVDVTWESCSLRKWLNEDFINEAFNQKELDMITTTNVSADMNPEYSTASENATNDKVFLLSKAEAEKYFNTYEARKCTPTAYAKSRGAWTGGLYKTADSKVGCWWWLRSLGSAQNDAAYVSDYGSVNISGISVNTDHIAVRPALWINLNP